MHGMMCSAKRDQTKGPSSISGDLEELVPHFILLRNVVANLKDLHIITGNADLKHILTECKIPMPHDGEADGLSTNGGADGGTEQADGPTGDGPTGDRPTGDGPTERLSICGRYGWTGWTEPTEPADGPTANGRVADGPTAATERPTERPKEPADGPTANGRVADGPTGRPTGPADGETDDGGTQRLIWDGVEIFWKLKDEVTKIRAKGEEQETMLKCKLEDVQRVMAEQDATNKRKLTEKLAQEEELLRENARLKDQDATNKGQMADRDKAQRESAEAWRNLIEKCEGSLQSKTEEITNLKNSLATMHSKDGEIERLKELLISKDGEIQNLKEMNAHLKNAFDQALKAMAR